MEEEKCGKSGETVQGGGDAGDMQSRLMRAREGMKNKAVKVKGAAEVGYGI